MPFCITFCVARRARRTRSRTRTIREYVRRSTRSARRRMGGRREAERYGRKALYGAAGGLAVAVPLGLMARYMNRPELFELGERGGAILASHLGGTIGQVGFQALDAVIERAIPRIASGPGGGIGRIVEAYG